LARHPRISAGGKGASFLNDIRQMSRHFDIQLSEKSNVVYHVLHLVPKEKTPDLDHILIWINRDIYDIETVATYNQFGDETIFRFTAIGFGQDLDPAMFRFDIPEGADVVYLDETQ